jgi:hypothetical protein
MGPIYFVFCRPFHPSSPQPPTAVFGSYLGSLILKGLSSVKEFENIDEKNDRS